MGEIPGFRWLTASPDERIGILETFQDALITNYIWTKNALSFSFPDEIFSTASYVPEDEEIEYKPFSDRLIEYTVESLKYLSSVVDIDFLFSAGDTDIKFGSHNMTAGGYASYPEVGNIYISNDVSEEFGGYAFPVIIHELGHALGLSHPADYSDGTGSIHETSLTYELDSQILSTMSYYSYTVNFGYSVTFRPLDIFALQQIYGINYDYKDEITFSFIDDADFIIKESHNGWDIGLHGPFMVSSTAEYNKLDFSKWNDPYSSLIMDLINREGYLGGEFYFEGSIYDRDEIMWKAIPDELISNITIYDLTTIQEIYATPFDDIIKVDEYLEYLYTGAGNDLIYGNIYGDLWLDGGDGFNTVIYEADVADFVVAVLEDGKVVVDKAGNGIDTIVSIDRIESADGELLYAAIVELVGTEANDVFSLGLGSYLVDGGQGGRDTVVYDVLREDTGIELLSDGTITVTKSAGTNTLISIERIEFDDGALLFDIESANLGFTYRIYAAGYGRTPDEGGLRYWVEIMDWLDENDPGAHKEGFLAAQFLGAEEFVQLYGENPSDEAYIDAMYQNVLDRFPDQSGYEFWVDAMQAGLDRADILVQFAESPENVVQTIPNLTDGVWVGTDGVWVG